MVPSVHSLQRSTEQLPSPCVANRCNHQTFAICGQGEGGIRADVEELKDTAVNHQSETISMLGQPLDHVESSLLIVITTYHLSSCSSSGTRGMNRGVRSMRWPMTHCPFESPAAPLHAFAPGLLAGVRRASPDPDCDGARWGRNRA